MKFTQEIRDKIDNLKINIMSVKAAKKKDLVEMIIEDLKENICDSQEYIFDLCREALMKRTKKELIEQVQIEEEYEEDGE